MIGFIAMIALAALFGVLATVFAALWVYRDATQRGVAPELWIVLVVITGIVVGLLLYLLLGRKGGTGTAPTATAGKGLLLACAACVVVALVAVGFGLYFVFTTPALLALQQGYMPG